MNPDELKEHERFLRRSIELAESTMKEGNNPFGAVLVKDGEILLEDANRILTDCDCTSHAEINLVRQACAKFDDDLLSQTTLYASSEPCIMCTGAIYWSGIPRIVYACSSTKIKSEIGDSLLIPSAEILARGVREVEVIGPILEQESLAVHKRKGK